MSLSMPLASSLTVQCWCAAQQLCTLPAWRLPFCPFPSLLLNPEHTFPAAAQSRVRWVVFMSEPLKASIEVLVGFCAGINAGADRNVPPACMHGIRSCVRPCTPPAAQFSAQASHGTDRKRALRATGCMHVYSLLAGWLATCNKTGLRCLCTAAAGLALPPRSLGAAGITVAILAAKMLQATHVLVAMPYRSAWGNRMSFLVACIETACAALLVSSQMDPTRASANAVSSPCVRWGGGEG